MGEDVTEELLAGVCVVELDAPIVIEVGNAVTPIELDVSVLVCVLLDEVVSVDVPWLALAPRLVLPLGVVDISDEVSVIDGEEGVAPMAVVELGLDATEFATVDVSKLHRQTRIRYLSSVVCALSIIQYA